MQAERYLITSLILNHDGTMNLKSGNPDTRTHSETCRKALLKVAREIVTGIKTGEQPNNMKMA